MAFLKKYLGTLVLGIALASAIIGGFALWVDSWMLAAESVDSLDEQARQAAARDRVAEAEAIWSRIEWLELRHSGVLPGTVVNPATVVAHLHHGRWLVKWGRKTEAAREFGTALTRIEQSTIDAGVSDELVATLRQDLEAAARP